MSKPIQKSFIKKKSLRLKADPTSKYAPYRHSHKDLGPCRVSVGVG